MAGLRRGNQPLENAVVVAVRAEREISKTALAWALTHVVRPGDFVTLLAVICNHDQDHRRRRLWSFPKFAGDCGGGRRGGSPENRRKCEVSASCSQMALQFHGFHDHSEVNMRIKVVVSTEAPSGGGGGGGTVVAESKRVGANWIVLDKQLKQEAKQCMQELPHCSIVLMKSSHAKVLRLNLGGAAPLYEPHSAVPAFTLNAPGRPAHHDEQQRWEHQEDDDNGRGRAHRLKHSTPTSSPDEHSKPTFLRDPRAFTSSSSTNGSASPFFVCEQNPLYEGLRNAMLKTYEEGAPESSAAAPLIAHYPWLNHAEDHRDSSSPRNTKRLQQLTSNPSEAPKDKVSVHHGGAKTPSAKTLQEKFVESDSEPNAGWNGLLRHTVDGGDAPHKSDARDAVSLFGNSSPCVPPPLCSICRHKAPVFGKPPRCFSFGELEEATAGFSGANFLAEGGFACAHRGVLRNGQVVAVKRLKAATGPEANDEFRAEVEVLSRAQHRNVVMLVGFCVEGARRALVYEYICNSSLGVHLYGGKLPPLDWHARFRVAVGSARGLRYLHEDCRVGFIHGDMRPNNILLTHDFEPLVGDFGLARWQADGNGVDTRIIGSFGYLAPEYIESGVITEKADVYAFGVVLLELVTGRRAMDMGQPKGQQFLAEWARPVLALAAEGDRTIAIERLLDPRLDQDQTRRFSHQLNAVAHAACLCLRREPQSRPSMSKVLRVLEGDAVVDPGLGGHQKGSRSGRFSNQILRRYTGAKGSLSQRMSHEVVAKALHADRDRTHVC